MTAVILQFVAMEPLPNRIREAREAKGWSMARLGEELNLTEQAVSYHERGVRELSINQLQRYAAALGCPVVDLLPEKAKTEGLAPAERALIESYRRGTPEQREQLTRMADVIVPWEAEPQQRKRA